MEINFQKLNLPAYDRGAYILTDIEDNTLIISSCCEQQIYTFDGTEQSLKDLEKLYKLVQKLALALIKKIESDMQKKRENIRFVVLQEMDGAVIKINKKYLSIGYKADKDKYSFSFRFLSSDEHEVYFHGDLWRVSRKKNRKKYA